MAKWLSAEWFDETGAMVADEPGPAGLTAGVQVEVNGGPDGDVRCYRALEDGRLTGRALGTLEDPDVTITLGWGDAVAIQQGDLDPNVAFMRGRMKVAGSMSAMLKLLAAAASPDGDALRSRIAALTDF